MIDLVGNRTLRDLIAERAQRYGSKQFLVCESADGVCTSLSFSELYRQTRALASGLANLGIEPGDSVMVVLPSTEELVLSFFAAAWLGATMVSANPVSSLAELGHVASHSDSVAIISSSELMPMLQELGTQAPALRTFISTGVGRLGITGFDALRHEQSLLPDSGAESEDVVQMLFTSGSTALPKGVLLTHANMLWAGERSVRNIGLQDTDRYLTALPFFHVNAQCLTLMPALTAGATCVMLERFSASSYFAQVRAHEATVTSLVATQVRTLLAQPTSERDRDHKIRRTFYSINVSDSDKCAFEERFGVEFLNGYGLTETCTNVTVTPLYGDQRWPSVGLPSLGRQVRVVDERGDDLPPGAAGEIIVYGVPGRTIMKGYYKDDAATAAAVRDGWLYTGDTGYLDDQGYLYFVDRRKDMIKRAGENISATEVEGALLLHPGIAEVAVIGVDDPIRDQAVAAFVVRRLGFDLDQGEVAAHCATLLAPFKVPTLIEFRDALPKTSIGKIEKKALVLNSVGVSGEQT